MGPATKLAFGVFLISCSSGGSVIFFCCMYCDNNMPAAIYHNMMESPLCGTALCIFGPNSNSDAPLETQGWLMRIMERNKQTGIMCI